MVVNKTFSFFTLSLPYMIEFAIFSILQQMALGIALAIPSSLKKSKQKIVSVVAKVMRTKKRGNVWRSE